MENQKIYQSKYGQKVHTMKPLYEVRGNHVYKTIYHPEKGNTNLAQFRITGNKMYTTATHSAGAQTNAWYQIKGKQIHNTGYHPEGKKNRPTFNFG